MALPMMIPWSGRSCDGPGIVRPLGCTSPAMSNGENELGTSPREAIGLAESGPRVDLFPEVVVADQDFSAFSPCA
jgi:hypothetical protein